jgi:acetyl-CoA carboxylase biotin carboxyl carrier protein
MADFPDKEEQMNLELIEKLIQLLENSSLNQLEVEQEGFRVSLQKQPSGTVVSAMYPPASVPSAPAAPGVEVAAPVPETGKAIEAPMVGTFYRAPAPDAPPYVEAGSSVSEDTVVCILEAMKVMNEIKSGIRGTIEKIMVENGQPVEYGQPLFTVKQ